VNTVINLRVPYMLGNFLVAAQLAASQEGLSSMELVSYQSVGNAMLQRCGMSLSPNRDD
jgi:hypothetical protein